jgi:hypothetical protein
MIYYLKMLKLLINKNENIFYIFLDHQVPGPSTV